ncbi:autophagy-related 10 isoform X1 [Amblyomma americanum]
MLEWDEFLSCCREIEAVSATLGDGWSCVVAKEGEPGFTYLEKKCSLLFKPSSGARWSDEDWMQEADPGCAESHAEEVLQCVYHIVYSVSYGVPVMYFNVWRQDGSLLPLSEVWSLMPDCLQEQLRELRWTTVTQQEHPVQGVPFFQLHPCKTAQLMEQTRRRHTKHRNYLITWLSTIAPVVGLVVPVQYTSIVAPAPS